MISFTLRRHAYLCDVGRSALQLQPRNHRRSPIESDSAGVLPGNRGKCAPISGFSKDYEARSSPTSSKWGWRMHHQASLSIAKFFCCLDACGVDLLLPAPRLFLESRASATADSCFPFRSVHPTCQSVAPSCCFDENLWVLIPRRTTPGHVAVTTK